MSAVAIVGTLSFATGVGASQDRPVGDKSPVTKQDCKDGGFKQFGFKNQGKCVGFVVKANKHNGYGQDRDNDRDDNDRNHNGRNDNDRNNNDRNDRGQASLNNFFGTVNNFFATTINNFFGR